MTEEKEIIINIANVMSSYHKKFSNKSYSETDQTNDLLMEVFNISQELKFENKQYWGRELGMCWQYLVIECCKNIDGYKPAIKVGGDEPADLIVNEYAIDTKYRVGSGDSGTLKKFKKYGQDLIDMGYKPIMLFVREDNLPAAITAMEVGKWKILTGEDSFNFIEKISGFDLRSHLVSLKGQFRIIR